MIEEIKLFIKQDPVEDSFILSLYSGSVVEENGRYKIAGQQAGPQGTFSVGQPIYDREDNLMGYLGVGLYDRLNYYTEGRFHEEDIPVEHWSIENPTKYCEKGKQVFTYWQRWAKEVSDDRN